MVFKLNKIILQDFLVINNKIIKINQRLGSMVRNIPQILDIKSPKTKYGNRNPANSVPKSETKPTQPKYHDSSYTEALRSWKASNFYNLNTFAMPKHCKLSESNFKKFSEKIQNFFPCKKIHKYISGVKKFTKKKSHRIAEAMTHYNLYFKSLSTLLLAYHNT